MYVNKCLMTTQSINELHYLLLFADESNNIITKEILKKQ